jgi:hypothetical protein
MVSAFYLISYFAAGDTLRSSPPGSDTGGAAHSGRLGKRANGHAERWNNTLRQRLARFVRKTLSFSRVRCLA